MDNTYWGVSCCMPLEGEDTENCDQVHEYKEDEEVA